MSQPTDDDIFAALLGPEPEPGSVAESVRRAIVNPDSDPGAAAALVRFRKSHADLLKAPRFLASVRAFQLQILNAVAESEAQPVPAPASKSAQHAKLVVPQPAPRQRTWRDLFDDLLAHCRAEFAAAGAKGGVLKGTPESVVSRILSSYINGQESGRSKDLDDPSQLWPVLLEIATRKLKQRLTPDTVANKRFADKFGEVLETVFDSAKDDRRRLIVAHTLFGHTPNEVAKLTGELSPDVRNVVRSMHADLLLLLNAA